MSFMIAEIPLSLYIHIPWCEKKCPYCDFNSHLMKSAIDEKAYVEALINDLETDLIKFQNHVNNRKLSSIFIGGGTPSLFSSASFKRLIKQVRNPIDFADDIEITSEANPGSSEVEKFAEFREAGVNRLSIGIQSFNIKYLKKLGRVHNQHDALNAANYAKQAGFDNFNLDLMFGLPNQSYEHALEDVQQAIELKSSHLSCYQLTIEPNTLFHHKPPITPDDDLLWEMQEAIQKALAKAEFKQYEVSAYAKPSQQCKHNLNYWKFGDYLGIGAGAHAKLTSHSGEMTRFWKVKHPTNYMKAGDSYIGGQNSIEPEQQVFEFMMNALRLTDGFDFSLLEKRVQKLGGAYQVIIDKHQRQGLIEIDSRMLKPTKRGRQLLDSMLQDYLAMNG